MSLFLCSECGAIENSNLVKKSVEKDGVAFNPFFPNMSLMEMMGNKSKPTMVVKDGETVVYKEAKDVVMLCSECNTGSWHGEFEKKKAEIDSYILPALFSRYNMLTKYDHLMGSVAYETKDNGEKKLVLTNPELFIFYKWAILLAEQMGKDVSKYNLMKEMEEDNKLFFIYRLYLEDSKNVVLPDLGTYVSYVKMEDLTKMVANILDKESAPSSAWLFINALTIIAPECNFKTAYSIYLEFNKISQSEGVPFNKLFIGKNLEKSLQYLLGHPDLVPFLSKDSKDVISKIVKRISSKHWKDSQSEEERQGKLKAAEEKRQRKLEKREKNEKNEKGRVITE